jgi:hypothetical protein|nr:MAG TPA_asm: hypothetical protein [Caudoviricetes sp.]
MSGEFASKGMAGSALGLAIGGLSAALLQGSTNGGGILGNILGGNNCAPQMAALGVIAEKDAKIAELTAQKYSDNQDTTLYQATRSENEKLENRLMDYIKPLSQESASNRERVAVLESQMKSNVEIADLREKLVRSELGAKIDNVAQTCGCGIAQLNNAVASLQNTVNGITQTIIPQSVICPPVMPRYNAWQAPATTDVAPATQPVSGTIRVQG